MAFQRAQLVGGEAAGRLAVAARGDEDEGQLARHLGQDGAHPRGKEGAAHEDDGAGRREALGVVPLGAPRQVVARGAVGVVPVAEVALVGGKGERVVPHQLRCAP